MAQNPIERFRRIRERMAVDEALRSEPEPEPEPERIEGPAWLYAPRSGGRCSLHAQLIAHFAEGATVALAAMATGIEEIELSRWILEGSRDPESPMRRLYVDVKAATASVLLEDIRKLRASGRWQAIRYVVESISKGSYEPTPREVVAPGVPTSQHELLAELRATSEEIERQLARDALLRQGEQVRPSEHGPDTEAESDARDGSDDPAEAEETEGPE